MALSSVRGFPRFAFCVFADVLYHRKRSPQRAQIAPQHIFPNSLSSPLVLLPLLSVDLNGADIERDVTDWWKSSYRLSKSLEDEFPAAAQCAAQLREDTTAFREHLPVIQVCADFVHT